MKRLIVAVTVALTCASGLAAQETKTKTEVKGAKPHTVSYTGCLQTGTETNSYIIDKVVPVRTTTVTEEVGTSGATVNTSTRYMLVPGERVTISGPVGQKVEVSGALIPAGEMKSRTKTNIENEHGKDTKVIEKTKTDNDMPHFRVTSIKHLNEPCQ